MSPGEIEVLPSAPRETPAGIIAFPVPPTGLNPEGPAAFLAFAFTEEGTLDEERFGAIFFGAALGAALAFPAALPPPKAIAIE
jgi:hypothetical protein